MQANKKWNAIFVSNKKNLEPGGGGVQWCTREYLETIKSTGITTCNISYDTPCDWPMRLQRRLWPSPYRGFYGPGIINKILKTAEHKNAKLIFLNNTDAVAMAPELRTAQCDLRLIFLSHGMEITDVVNNLRIAPEIMPGHQKDSRWLGKLIKIELKIRKALDGVFCLSKEDVAFEQWLGSQHVQFIPRQIKPNPLKLNPIKGRVGTVGSFDHGPNLHGLRLLAKALSAESKLEIRMVGGPEKIGLSLQDKFNVITYLGRLSEEELEKEATSWCAFVNPIFCHARGASTKVATALGWGLPVLTTSMGARGYIWDKNLIPLRDTPAELAAECNQVAESDNLALLAQKAHQLAKLAPSIEQAAGKLGDFLAKLQGS